MDVEPGCFRRRFGRDEVDFSLETAFLSESPPEPLVQQETRPTKTPDFSC
jgi:hypothetical protein